MSRYANPFFTDPGFAQGFGALAQAFMPDPNREAATAARVGQARLAGVQADQINARMNAGRAAGDRLRAGDVSPGALAQVFADVLTGADPALIQQLPAFIRGFGGAAGADPERLAQLFVGAGGNYAHTEPGFRQADSTDRRGQDVSAGATVRAAQLRANADLEGVRLQEAGRNQRFAPEINQGNVVVVPPDSPLASRAGPDGRIQGNPRPRTFDEERAGLVRPYVEGTMPADQRGAARDIVAPSVSAAEARTDGQGRPPIEIGGADARAIDEQIAANLPSGISVDDEGARILRGRIAELWQQNRNLPLAAQQAVREFTESAQYTPGWNPFRRSGTMSPPAADAPPPSGAQAAPARPTQQAPAAAPQRPAGVPAGSAFSPSRQMWRAPDGRMFTADGRPVA